MKKELKLRDIYTNCHLKYVVVINMLSVRSHKTKIRNVHTVFLPIATAHACVLCIYGSPIHMYEKPRTDWKMFSSYKQSVIFTTLVGRLIFSFFSCHSAALAVLSRAHTHTWANSRSFVSTNHNGDFTMIILFISLR